VARAALSAVPSRWKVFFVALYLLTFAAHLPWLAGQLAHKTEVMGTDFTIFYSGWTLVLRGRGRELYDLEAQRAVQHELMTTAEFPGGIVPFIHPPHAALVMAPLALLPRTAATWLWTLVQLALLARLIHSLARVAGVAKMDRWLLAAAVLAFTPVFASLQMGQLSIILAVALLELVLAVEDGRDLTGAICLLVLSFKPPFLLAAVTVLVAARRWRVLARASVLAVLVAAATMAVLGASVYRDYVAAVPKLEPFWGNAGPRFMVNFRGTLSRLFGEDAAFVTPATWVGVAGATLAGYWLARRRAPAEAGWPAALALALVFSPHLFLHDALLWVVPLALSHRELRRASRDPLSFDLFALSWPLASIVNEAVEQRGHLLPVHLLVVAGAVGAAWMIAIQPKAVTRGTSARAAGERPVSAP
jgi:hypothetical protein